MSERNGNGGGLGHAGGSDSPQRKRVSKLGGLIARLRPRTFRAKMAIAFSVMFVVMLAAVFAVQFVVTNLAFQRSITVFHRDGSRSETDTEGYALPDGKGNTHVELFGGGSTKSNDELIEEFDKLGAAGAPDDDFRLDTPQGVMVFTRDAMTDALRFSSIIVFILFGLLSLTLIWWLTSHLSRRLASIAEQTAALDPSDLSARIMLDEPRGEKREHKRRLRFKKSRSCDADDAFCVDSDDNPAGTALAVYPGDEVTRLGEAINGMLDRVEKASRAERQFVSNASHELRTPIAAIRTSLEAPLSQGRFDPSVEPAVRRALAANERGEHLVEALLQLSRIQSGYYGRAEASQAEAADLAAIVTECAERYRGQFDAHSMTLEWDGGKDDLAKNAVVIANPALMTLTIDNLIRNAVIHGRDGGNIRISLATTRISSAAGGTVNQGRRMKSDETHTSGISGVRANAPSNAEVTDVNEMMRLIIANDSRGDLPADLDELVQPFHRGANSRISATPGVGLGLSIVASAAEACGARLELHSPTPGRFEARIVGLDLMS